MAGRWREAGGHDFADFEISFGLRVMLFLTKPNRELATHTTLDFLCPVRFFDFNFGLGSPKTTGVRPCPGHRGQWKNCAAGTAGGHQPITAGDRIAHAQCRGAEQSAASNQ